MNANDASIIDARMIVDPPQPGSWNMAVDESLMHSVGADAASQPVVRFYQWSEPTLSLGYFQKHADRNQHPPSLDIPLVRRNSGGGAIVHDHELTYSVTIHESHPLVRKSSHLYRIMHQTLMDALSEFGLDLVINENLADDLENRFLCFQRRAPNDVLLNGHKICGSAQRKKFHALSQHGSIILQTSKQAPEIIGINDISRKNLGAEAVISAWVVQICHKTGWQMEKGPVTEEEKQRAIKIQKVKFSTIKWGTRR